MIGDSLTAGWGSNGAGGGGGSGAGNATNYLRTKGSPAEIRKALNTAGVATRSDAWVGTGASAANTIAEAVAANPALTIGANWSVWTSNLFAGAYSFLCAASNVTTTLAFTPEVAANRFIILYTKFPTGGTFKVFDGGGDLSTGNSTNGAEATGYLTVSRTAASTNSISIQQTATGGLFIWGIIPYDTTAPKLEIINMGYAGSKVSDWLDASHAYSPFNVLPQLGCLAYAINLGVNDAAAGVSNATYQANLQTLISQCATTSGVQLIKPSTSTDSHNVPAGYLTAIDALAAPNGLPPAIDYNSINMVLGTDRFDSVHLTNAGYVKEAAVAAPIIKALLGA